MAGSIRVRFGTRRFQRTYTRSTHCLGRRPVDAALWATLPSGAHLDCAPLRTRYRSADGADVLMVRGSISGTRAWGGYRILSGAAGLGLFHTHRTGWVDKCPELAAPTAAHASFALIQVVRWNADSPDLRHAVSLWGHLHCTRLRSPDQRTLLNTRLSASMSGSIK